jgi:hypothetical protein
MDHQIVAWQEQGMFFAKKALFEFTIKSQS